MSRVTLSPGAGTALLAAAAAVALLTNRLWVVILLTGVLLVVCLRAPASRRWPYLIGALTSGLGVLLISPFLWSSGGGTLLWEGPTIPVVGTIDISTDEIQQAAVNGFRLAAVGLAFAVYALLLDHDRLVGSARFARRSALAVALATRLVPTLERDAIGLRETVRGRGVELSGARAYAKLLSPLMAGSLERASCLAEAMEARGFGRPGATRQPRPSWTRVDRLAVLAALFVVTGAAVWR